MASSVVGSALPGPAKVASVSLANKGLKFAKGPSPGSMTIVSQGMAEGTYSGAYMAERQLSTQNAYGSALQGGITQIDFKLTGPSAALDLVTLMSYDLEFTITNNDGANPLTLLPAVYALQQIQLLLDGKSVLTYLNPRQIERRMIGAMSQREFQSIYPLLGYPSDVFGTGGVTVAAGASRTFRIPMHYIISFMRQLPCLQAVSTEVTFRFRFNTGADYRFSTSTSTDMNVSLMQMVVSGHVLSPSATSALVSAVRASSIVLPAIYPINRQNTFGAVAQSGFTGKWVLNQKGWCSQIAVDIYATPPATPQAQLSGLTGFQQFYFYDASSQLVNVSETYSYQLYALNSMIYGGASPPAVLPRTVADGTLTGYSSFQYVDVGPNLPFCDEIVAILADKKRYGSFNLVGSETINIQAPDIPNPYPNMTIQVFFDLLATVTQNTDGRLAFEVIQ